MAGQSIVISVLADTKKFGKGMAGSGGKLDGFMKKLSTFGKVAAVAFAGLTIAGGVYLKKAIDNAGNLEQSIGAVDSIFGESAKQMHDWAKAAAVSAGVSRDEYNTMANELGALLKNMGVSTADLGKKTNDLITLGADLASMFGGTTKDAVDAMSSAYKGQFDPLEKYGVKMSAAAVKAQALAMGVYSGKGELTEQAKQLAINELLLQQTADAQGNFAREVDTTQHQQQVFNAQMENLSATIGTYFLPVLTTLLSSLNGALGPAMEWVAGVMERNVAPALQSLGDWITSTVIPAAQSLWEWFQNKLAPALSDVWGKITNDLVPAFMDITSGIRDNAGPALEAVGGFITDTLLPAIGELVDFVAGSVIPAISDMATWFQENADWIGAVAVVIATLAAPFAASALAVQAISTALAIWKAVTVAATAVQAAFNVVLTLNPIGLVVMAIAALIAGLVWFFTQTEVGREAWAKFTGFMKTAWDAIVNWFNSTLESVKTWFSDAGQNIMNAWDKVKTWFEELPGKIKAFFSDAVNLLLTKGQEIIDGLKKGAENAWTTTVEWIKDIPNKIKNALSGAADWLYNVGKDVLTGLWNGLSSKVDWVVSKVKGIADDVIKGAKAVFGIASPSKVFRGIGDNIMAGLEGGLRDTYGVRSAMGELEGLISGNLGAEFAVPAGATVNVYQFDGLGITPATDGENDLLSEFVKFARRRARAGGAI